jgi:hypothetical protein
VSADTGIRNFSAPSPNIKFDGGGGPWVSALSVLTAVLKRARRRGAVKSIAFYYRLARIYGGLA